MCDQIENRNINFIREASGLIVKEIKNTVIDIAKINPLRPGSQFKELPNKLARKKAIINVQNKDNRCFGYAILSAIQDISRKPQRPLQYDHLFKKYGLNTIEYPVKPESIPQLELHLNISINIYSFIGDEGDDIYPLYVTKRSLNRHIDLLYWDEHYAWIKNFSRFACGSVKHNGTLFYCKRCLSHFRSSHDLELHEPNCEREDFSDECIHMPHSGSILEFENKRFQKKQPIIIYADCESLLEECYGNQKLNKNTILRQHHNPCSV